MDKIPEFILLFLSQFAGGPGPVENNLVRFGLPAILWAVLFYIAWSRQRSQNLPREKLLVWGFGLAFVRELYMFAQMSYRLLGSNSAEATCDVIQPLEHGLAMAAMVLVAGAFLLYILEDPKIARRYLQIGIGITLLMFIITSLTWPRTLSAYPQIKFHQTYAAWLFHIPLTILMGVAIFLLWRKQGWLRNVVVIALGLYLTSELLLLLNFATDRAYNSVICPIGNSLHILAIPLFGYVYLHEQSLEKKQADDNLKAYRDHLEDLVKERTAELTEVNVLLNQEVLDRTQAEEALERITHRYELILESAGEGICGIDRQGQLIFVNPAAARMLGYSTSEMINHPSHSIWHKAEKENQAHTLTECPIYQGYSLGQQRYGDDEFFTRKDGQGFPVRYFSNPVSEKGELTGAVIVFQDITERKRNEAEITQRNASLATQNAVASTLSQSLKIEDNLKNVLEMVRIELEMEIGLIFLLDPANGILSLHLHCGLYSTDNIQVLIAENCHCHQVSNLALLHKQTIASKPEDFLSGSLPSQKTLSGINNLVSTPLVSKGRAVGVMTLGTRNETAIPTHKIELLTAIGLQIGMALENARMYEDAENWAGELTRLHEASSHLTALLNLDQVTSEIAHQSAWLLKCQKACVIRLNGMNNSFELVAAFGFDQNEQILLQDQLPNWTFITELGKLPETISIQEASSDSRLPHGLGNLFNIHSALLVPIWSSGKPRDFIVLMDVQTTREWSNREIELVEGLANRAAVALVNANLHQQIELSAALEERQRIAANMHDGLAQTLSLLGLRVDRMQELVTQESNLEAETQVNQIREVVAQATNEVRRSIASLQESPRPRSSLQELLRDLLNQLHSTDGPKIRLDLETIEELFIPSDQVDQVLPVVQEAVLNASRHADAQNIIVHLGRENEKVCIMIRDDGCGFDLNTPRQNGDHFGLSIMQARIRHIGGQIQINTSPGNGTQILLTWSLNLNDKYIPKPHL